MPEVLAVDDDPSVCRLLEVGLNRRGFDVRTATSAADALRHLERNGTDVLLTDVIMDGMDGLELCGRVASERPDVPVVVMTASVKLATAIGAIRAGASDFVTKPVDLEEWASALNRVMSRRALADPVERAAGSLDEMLGASPAMQRLYGLLMRVSSSDVSVLITGESGTGKELAARTVHRHSPRNDGPFVAINCSAIPEPLLESELFGHDRGAFTDARQRRTGLFAAAAGGTLFLDELGDLPPALQPKLLRALQERRVRPVGAEREVPFDARVIAASNQDLLTAVGDHRFREDLFFRLAVVQIEVPRLRDRGDDVALLANHFLEQAAKRTGRPRLTPSPRTLEYLRAYSWPGNVRELQNTMEGVAAMSVGPRISPIDLPARIRTVTPSRGRTDPFVAETLSAVERRHILRVLEAVGQDKSRASRLLGINRRTLYRKLERYGLHRSASTGSA